MGWLLFCVLWSSVKGKALSVWIGLFLGGEGFFSWRQGDTRRREIKKGMAGKMGRVAELIGGGEMGGDRGMGLGLGISTRSVGV